jgi:hypothetical protein
MNEYRPISQFTSTGPIEFHIPGSDKTYKALHESSLKLKVRIVRKDGALLTAADKVSFINVPLQTLFSKVDVYVQGEQVSSMDSNQAYRGYLQTLLNYGDGAKKSQLTAQLWYSDTADYFNETDPQEGGNAGLSIRNSYSKNSQIVDLEGPLLIDLMSIDRYLINGVDVKLNLHRSSDAFCLMSPDNEYTVEIMEAVFRVPHIFVSSSLMLAHAKVIDKSPAMYPMKRTVIKTETLTAGATSYVKESLFEYRIPNRLVICLVDNIAYTGASNKNPLLFHHFNLKHINVSINGNSLNAQPFTPSFEGDKTFVSNYLSLFRGMGSYREDAGVSLDRDDYDGGYCVFVFDLTSDPNIIGSGLINAGNLRIEIQFGSGLEAPVSLIAYGEFSGLLQIDRSRTVKIV